MSKAGFVISLIGLGGMAEAYGLNKSFALSLTMVVVGGLMVWIGDMSNDIKNYKRSNNADSNILDRLYFLRK